MQRCLLDREKNKLELNEKEVEATCVCTKEDLIRRMPGMNYVRMKKKTQATRPR